MRLRTILMLDVGLIAAACLVPLAPVIAQGAGTAPEAGRGPAHVMRVQQDLNDHGFHVPVNGVMGAETVAALRRYQQQNGLPATGQIDGQTFTSLEGIAPPTVERATGLAPVVVPYAPAPPPPPPG